MRHTIQSKRKKFQHRIPKRPTFWTGLFQDIISERPMKRDELLKMIGEVKSKYSSYIIDDIAKAAGHTVLRLPPYHCEFNPIDSHGQWLKSM